MNIFSEAVVHNLFIELRTEIKKIFKDEQGKSKPMCCHFNEDGIQKQIMEILDEYCRSTSGPTTKEVTDLSDQSRFDVLP